MIFIMWWSARHLILGGLQNVRYLHKADIPAYLDLCPLLGVKQTFWAEWIYVRL
jgi:hypothetical protein